MAGKERVGGGLLEDRVSWGNVKQAGARIEAHPGGRGAWLLRFINHNLAELTEGQQLDLLAETHAFLFPWATWWPDMKSSDRPLGWEGIRTVQAELRRAMEALDQDLIDDKPPPGCSFAIPEMKIRLRRVPRGLLRIYAGDDRTRFLAVAADVLVESWPRVRRCPVCRSWFWRSGRRDHCSARCASRARWARYMERHPKQRGDYREDYRRKVQGKLGPNVKVTTKR